MRLASKDPLKLDFQVAKLERETLHDRAYHELRKAIMSGAIRPGSTITIRAMAAALGTSPMPVREALRRLVAERALETLPTRSVTLPSMTPTRFDEICRIRIALEGMVSETGAGRITPEALRRMHQIQSEMQRIKPNRAAEYLAKNQELHFTLYEAAGMPVAMQMIESLWLQAGPHLNLSIAEGGFSMGEDHHRELLEGLSRHDVKAARVAIEADISDAAIVIRKFLESRKVSAA
ncbi:MAG TPA: GntR family transcriptional regulator [Dongiaceae bacterium]|jgi:DNA-binding GntR family transcriptional regulator